MTNFLSYEDQIFLLGYWLRTNVKTIVAELAKNQPDWKAIRSDVRTQLQTEFGITGGAVIYVVKQIMDGYRLEKADELPEITADDLRDYQGR